MGHPIGRYDVPLRDEERHRLSRRLLQRPVHSRDRCVLDHQLHGDYEGYRECHITPDWLLIYIKDTDIKIISLSRTGTHSDLFSKKNKQKAK